MRCKIVRVQKVMCEYVMKSTKRKEKKRKEKAKKKLGFYITILMCIE